MKGGTGEQRLGADLQCRGGAPSAAKSMQQSNGSSAKSSCDAECGGAGAAAGGGGAAAPADGTSAPQMRHYWEESVFEGHPMSDTCRWVHRMVACLDRRGTRLPHERSPRRLPTFALPGRQGLRYGQLVPLCRASSKQPLLLSSVKGKSLLPWHASQGTNTLEVIHLELFGLPAGNDSEGRPFRWVARRQRKRVSHPHQCPTPPPALRWLGWLDVRLHSAKPGWWVGLLFTLGSVCFVLSGAAALWRSVGDAAEPAGLASLAAALVSWPNAVAANLCFFPAGLLQVPFSLPCLFLTWLALACLASRAVPLPAARRVSMMLS